MNAEDKLKVTITKNFKSLPEEVFDAWVDTRKISRWMFGPEVREEEIIKLENNPEPGGTFSFVVRRGADEINHLGEYLEIKRPEKLVFTWGIEGESEDESVVRVEITPIPGGCLLTLVHELDPKWEEYTERTQEGWNTMLEKLEEFIL